MLLTNIKDTFGNNSNKFYKKVFGLSLMYSVKALTAFEFQKALNTVCKRHCVKQSTKVFRLKLCDSSYFLLNIKLFMLNYINNKLHLKNNRQKLISTVRAFAIKKEDYLSILGFLTSSTNKNSVVEACSKIANQKIPSLLEVECQFNTIYTDIISYVKHITYKKLTFIINSNNMCPNSLHSELITKALTAYYQQVPNLRSDLHIRNYLKRVIHNHALNIIAKYTFSKRIRLVNVGGNYVLNVTSENQMLKTEDGESGFDAVQIYNEPGYGKVESDNAISVMLSNSGDHRRTTLLRLVLGEYDNRFTQYLHNEKVIPESSNNDTYYSASNVKTYVRHACSFLNIKPNAGNNIIRDAYAKYF